MNGKTAKKLLMRSRVGRRAYLTVRLPASLVPHPEPLEFEGMRPVYAGGWEKPDGSEAVDISHVYGRAESAPQDALFIEPEWSEEFAGERVETVSWWEGRRLRRITAEAEDGYDSSPLEPGLIARHRDFALWRESLTKYGTHPVLDWFVAASEWAKDCDAQLRGEDLLLTYSVKWCYPRRKLGFSAALARAVREAKRAGVPVRVVRV
jgi:hypothetical protein